MSEKRLSIIQQLFPPEPKWLAENVPDQTGKVAIITGGHRGIGKETAQVLLSKGAKVYITTRSEEGGERAVDELKEATGKASIFFIKLDLQDLLSVKTAAEEFISKESELHTLYNSGGVMYVPAERVTSQGYDLQFGTNVLGHFYLTKLLLPVLTATAKKAPAKSVRVVNVSSLGHYFGAPEGIRWTSLNPGTESLEERKKLGSARLFGQSKTGNILFSNELARRYDSEGIVSISVHPGTSFSLHAGSLFHRIGRLFKYALYYVVSCGEIDFLTEESKAVSESAQRTRDSAKNAVTKMETGAKDAVTNLETRARDAVTTLETGVKDAATDLETRAKDAVVEIETGAKDARTKIEAGAKDAVAKIEAGAKDAAASPETGAKDAAASPEAGAKDAAPSPETGAKDAATSPEAGAKDAATNPEKEKGAKDAAANPETEASKKDAAANVETEDPSDSHDGIEIPGAHGAINSLYAGTAPAAGDLNGKYITAWARPTLPHPKAVNPDTEKKLWDWCEDQVKDIGKKA